MRQNQFTLWAIRKRSSYTALDFFALDLANTVKICLATTPFSYR